MTGKHPGLRSHTRKRKSGKVKTYYFLDRRTEGLPDVPLGTDYDGALKKYTEIRERAPRLAGTLLEAFERYEREIMPTLRAVTARGYRQNLTRITPVFGPATWDSIRFSTLTMYLDKRTAKTQGNRELSLLSIIWNKARRWGLTDLPWPAAGLERSGWKNAERPREFEVTTALFEAVYADGDQVLRDCMDLSSATGMRLTDCREIVLPRDDTLRLKASKTGKRGEFAISASPVLSAIVARRRAIQAQHLMLLSTPTGRRVSATMLRDRYELARERAAVRAYIANDDEFARQIKAMVLRDMRKRAADLADDAGEAQALLQHGSRATTVRHYRTKAERLKPAR